MVHDSFDIDSIVLNYKDRDYTQIISKNNNSTKINSEYEILEEMNEVEIQDTETDIIEAVSKLKGTMVSNIFEEIGHPIKIDMKWEEAIIRKIENRYSTINKKIESTWTKPNIFTRNFAQLPGNKKIEESYPNLIILFDQSGSMSDIVVRKINYIISYFFRKKFTIDLYIHDFPEKKEDVFYQRLDKLTNISNIINFRNKNGGTSHKIVFDILEEKLMSMSGLKTLDKNFVIIASDLESDIFDIYNNYTWIAMMSTNIIAVTDGNITLPFGNTIKVL